MSIEEYVERKLKSGTYKLMDNERGTSAMWSIFARIGEENGSVLDGFIYCRQCKGLIKYSRKIKSQAYRHKCYAEQKKNKAICADNDEDPPNDSLINESDPISPTEQLNVYDNRYVALD